MPLEYTADLGTLARAAGDLTQQLGLDGGAERRKQVAFLDTFDWALYRAGLRLTQSEHVLELSAQPAGTVVLRSPGEAVHRLAADLPVPLRAKLGALLGLRALLPVAEVTLTEVVLVSRNSDDKIVARLVLARPVLTGAAARPGRANGRRQPPLRLTVVPLRGYAKEAHRLATELSRVPGVLPAEASLFTEAVAATGRSVGDYSGKLALRLRPDESAYDAARQIFGSQLAMMTATVDGVIADLDTEFLHDFRVAVRRTRSALKELPGILPPRPEAHFRGEFKWLGDVTTPSRDLDVYLLTYPEFGANVGGPPEELEPLRQLLISEKRAAHRELARHLRGARYRRLCTEWARWHADSPPGELGPAASALIGEVADARIRRVSRRVLRAGAAITDESPDAALHDLRKRCKELRYLLEFFGGLYPPATTAGLVAALKGLQDNLGEFQDTAVQHAAVDRFAEALHTDRSTPAATLLALGRLGGVLIGQQHQARAEFAERFAAFAAPENRRRLEELSSATAGAVT